MVKWQTISVGSIVTLVFLLGGLLNLSGVSFSDDGDKTCTDCFSEIQVKSTYWEIKVENAGEDKPSVFKKRTRSRTLWVNLDKINELITTDPAIEVDILVPAIKRTSSMKHEDYGYLRPLKDGDTLIKRNTKSRPSPSRIILHAENVNMIVKWNFDLEHWLIQDINIDPIWFGEEPKPEVDVIPLKLCSLEYFDVIESVYENITKTQRTYKPCVVYYNYTFIDNITFINEIRTIISNDSCPERISYIVEEQVGEKTVTKSREVCKVVGAKIDGIDLNWNQVEFNCKRTGSIYTCDSQNADGNGDGVCDSGESTCFTFDIRNVASDNRLKRFR